MSDLKWRTTSGKVLIVGSLFIGSGSGCRLGHVVTITSPDVLQAAGPGLDDVTVVCYEVSHEYGL